MVKILDAEEKKASQSSDATDILSASAPKIIEEPDYVPYEQRKPLSSSRLKRGYTSAMDTPEAPYIDFIKKNKTPVILTFAVAAAIGMCVWMIFYFFLNTHPVQVTITGFEWQRQIEVEKYSVLSEGGWSRPSDAYNVERHWRYHYSRDVFSHYEYYQCGTSSRPQTCSRAVYRSEAVYDWYYYYNVDRWITSRWLVTSASDQNPQWAAIPSTFRNVALIGQERQGNQTKERYTVHTDKGYDLSVKEAKFKELTVGQTGTANVTNRNKVRSVDWDSNEIVNG